MKETMITVNIMYDLYISFSFFKNEDHLKEEMNKEDDVNIEYVEDWYIIPQDLNVLIENGANHYDMEKGEEGYLIAKVYMLKECIVNFVDSINICNLISTFIFDYLYLKEGGLEFVTFFENGVKGVFVSISSEVAKAYDNIDLMVALGNDADDFFPDDFEGIIN